jgi:hypothetical protein
MSKRDDFRAPRVDHPTGPGADLSEDQADAATRTLARTAVHGRDAGRGVTGPEFTEALRMLGLLATPAGDAQARPLGGTRRTT